MGDVLDRWRINNGWNPLDNKSQMAAICSFVATLDRAHIPESAYMELYERALEVRAAAMTDGRHLPGFGADLMLACWPAVEAEMRQREIDAGRTLTATAPSQCLRCYGTGMEAVFDGNRFLGRRPGCKHEYIDMSDPSTEGMQAAFEALRTPAKDESALDICKRIRLELSYMVVTAIDGEAQQQAWEASRTWAHAERYVRENG